jgi:hypothetical protein
MPEKSFSPLAEPLPARTNPQWVWLQTRYASAMSYELARKFLALSLTGATELPASSIRSNVQRIGAKLESEMAASASEAIDGADVVLCAARSCGDETVGTFIR